MAGRTTSDDVDLAPAEAPARADYERDFYSWSQQQARLLREGRWSAVDRENVAEEVESLGREQFNKLDSALRVLLVHMLKWDHQPERRSRSWALSIDTRRLEIEDVLGDNPGLRPRIGEAVTRAYRKARNEAASETGLERSVFPSVCRIHGTTSRDDGLPIEARLTQCAWRQSTASFSGPAKASASALHHARSALVLHRVRDTRSLTPPPAASALP